MERFKFKWKTGKKFSDKRGFLKKIIDGNFSSCIEVKSKKGSVRANHYHKKDKHFVYIITGEILYFYRNRKKGAQTKHGLMKKGVPLEYHRSSVVSYMQEQLQNANITDNKLFID